MSVENILRKCCFYINTLANHFNAVISFVNLRLIQLWAISHEQSEANTVYPYSYKNVTSVYIGLVSLRLFIQMTVVTVTVSF